MEESAVEYVQVNGSKLTIGQLVGNLRSFHENVAQKTISDSLKEELLRAERLHAKAIARHVEDERNAAKYHLVKFGDLLRLVPTTMGSAE